MDSNYTPTKILEDQTALTHVEIDSVQYVIANIAEGRIYTNRNNNISVMSGDLLVPHVSWQCKERMIAPDCENLLLTGQIQIQEAPKVIDTPILSLVTGSGGNYNYFHWLYDSLPRMYLAKKHISLQENIQYYIPEDTHYFQKETLAALKVNHASYISSKAIQHLKAKSIIATSHPNPNTSRIPKWIYRFLRSSFLQNSDSKKQRLIYISRSDSINSRRLINEDKLVKALVPLGFEVYQLSELSFSDQVSLFSSAKMVVGAHGAGLTNLTFVPKGAVVYELFPERYQPDMYECISQLGKLYYHKIICKSANSNQPDPISDLIISDDDILKIAYHAKLVNSEEKIGIRKS